MTETLDSIRSNARLAGEVVRYHTMPVLRRQTVAEHSWQVLRIYDAMFGTTWQVAKYIMYHDIGEVATGDIPYPVKADVPELKAMMDTLEYGARERMGIYLPTLTVREQWMVKVAHLTEMMEFGQQEVQMGNRLAQPIYDNCRRALERLVSGTHEGVTRDMTDGAVNYIEGVWNAW